MDAVERLSLEQAGESSLIAVTHVHRYELAAKICDGSRVLDLCCGSGYGSAILAETAVAVTGVDVHEPSVERARAALGDGDRVEFEAGDALEWLERPLAADFDAIVVLEGLEHLRDPAAALERLRHHAEDGVTLVLSLPNSRPFREQNPHHVTEFDYDSALAAFERLPGASVLYQFHAEGSLIRAAEAAPLDARLGAGEEADPEHCNHFLAIVNADPERLQSATSARMQLAVAAAPNRYMLDLERQNRALWQANQRLARDKLGVADSAAAAALRPADEEELPRGLERVAVAGTKVARVLATIVLSILPHAVTLIVLRIRSRLRQDRET